MLFVASSAAAQNAVVRGFVRDVTGEAIGGATVTAESTEWNRPVEAVTDDQGRFSLLGLQGGRWLFVVTKQGFEPTQVLANVRRLGESQVIEFAMDFDVFHPPPPTTGRLGGVTAEQVQAELDAANDLFDQGDYDSAIAAYQSVLEQIPFLTSLNVQIGHAYREKQDYDRALAAYRAVPASTSASAEAASAIEELATLEGGR